MVKRLFLVVIIVLNCLLFSCKEKKLKGDEGKLEYLYYPERNVYYSPNKKLFYYTIDGAKSWDSVALTTDQEPDYLGEKVVLETDQQNVFVDNAEHRKLYSGVLYNLAGGNTSAILATAEVSERKVIKKKKIASSQTTEDQKSKKGLGKLIDKIFGKRDKK